MKKFKLSIALLTYNHERYIENALESILSQKISCDYEIVVGEDFSTDRTREILLKFKKKYPNKIKLIFREKNIGITPNFTNLLEQCEGEYIALIEGDDYWIDNQKLEEQINYLEDNIKIAGVAHLNKIVNEKNETINEAKKMKQELRFSLDKLCNDGLLYQTSSLVFRNCLDTNDLNLIKNIDKKVGDLTLAILILKKGDIYILNKYMSAYRIDVTNLSSSSSAKAIKDIKLFYKEYYSYLERLEKELLDNNKELYFLKSSILLGYMLNSLKNKDFLNCIFKEKKISLKVKKSFIKLIFKISLNKLKKIGNVKI